ncbi:MAG TPA: DUF2600 family protein [Solirubrobacteraceae bacterium]|jgi:tetraprenyl-beta-curcumene synthase|nr:DUF2600 family protein [Solirubrobacteraceae bacterium]
MSTAATVTRALARELLWGLRQVSREVAMWRALAGAIPDADLRADALSALARKRGNINGAALFWTLPDKRNANLLGVLVAYEVLADYLDCVSERGAGRGIANGQQLHLALEDALDPDAPLRDYYRFHHCGRDGGYLLALVHSCRAGCAELPSYEAVKPHIARAAALSRVLAHNHEPDPALRERRLTEWVGSHWPTLADETGAASWFERAAGASAWLTVLAMLALAAEPRHSAHVEQAAQATYDAYLRWIAPAGAMLDSYGDIAEDRAHGDHSYIAHYPDTQQAVARVGELVRRSRHSARALSDGPRHWLVAACMIAFYLSKDSVRTPAMRAGTRELARAGGPLVRTLLPVLRLWRLAYGQRSA